MRGIWLASLLAFAALSQGLHALSLPAEITPESQNHGEVVFEIHSAPLPNGDTQFTVAIKKNARQVFRTVEFPPPNYRASLGLTTFPVDGSGKQHSDNFGDRDLRDLTSELAGDVIKYVFSVTREELGNPDLSFCFWYPCAHQMLCDEIYFVRLKKYLKP